MDQLRQISAVRQDDNNAKKIWFHCQSADLFVWTDRLSEQIVRFEFYFDKPFAEQACLWKQSSGLSFRTLDDGEDIAGRARTPILGHSASLQKDVILSKFNRVNELIEYQLRAFVAEHLS